MALTVVKYRKTANGETTATPAILVKHRIQAPQQQFNKKPILRLDGGTGLVINKIPATIKTMKRNATAALGLQPKKYSLQSIGSTGTPLPNFQWQQTIGGPGGTTITTINSPKKQHQQLGAAISALPPSTIIQAKGNSYLQMNGGGTVITPAMSTPALCAVGGTQTVRRPTIFIKRETPVRTIRTITIELIEKSPLVHLGVSANRMPLLKNVICTRTNVTLTDCYITLKKLRQNEEFVLLAEYFELSEAEVQQIFARSVVRLASYLRHLIRWPDSKRYYDRHKSMPFAFRSNLSQVQSLIECVETDMHRPPQTTLDCSQYKFILSVMPNGIISYVSDAFLGNHDDLAIFSAVDFKNVIPKYLSMVADPGKGIRRRHKPKKVRQSHTAETDSSTDSAEESAEELDSNANMTDRSMTKYATARIAGDIAADQTLQVVNNELRSTKVRDFSVPTMRVREPVCRLQIRFIINALREFKILQPYAIQESLLYQYLNEALIVVAALTNLQR